MNELKPEDVMKALECCQSVTPIDCRNCPYKDQTTPEYKSCCNLLVADALALLREKDAEIERLQKHNTEMARKHYNDGKADTVRKMSERLKAKAKAHYFDNYDYAVSVENIDQIAKEMLEGE